MAKTNDPNKPRIIVDYKNITSDILELFSQRYPYGYEDEDVIKFKNSKGEMVRAIPFETSKAKYLVKVSTQMDAKIDAFLEEDEEYSDSSSELSADASEKEPDD